MIDIDVTPDKPVNIVAVRNNKNQRISRALEYREEYEFLRHKLNKKSLNYTETFHIKSLTKDFRKQEFVKIFSNKNVKYVVKKENI